MTSKERGFGKSNLRFERYRALRGVGNKNILHNSIIKFPLVVLTNAYGIPISYSSWVVVAVAGCGGGDSGGDAVHIRCF
ncbi:hypothetical protein M0802_007271 [Mischocyttarus mexicanus]|nr:hypothetical protein M0802_007271 [Mischocyttarus mexicanus]